METILNKESRAAIELMVADGIIAKDTAERYFPELKESEDERIRKEIITHFKAEQLRIKDSKRYNSWLTWLEKQCSQIPANSAKTCKNEQKPVISDDALREGIAHFGITQYQIDNWLKNYVDVEKQGEEKSIDPDTLIQQRLDALAYIVADQKPTDKVEPKFKVGDWIIKNDDSSINIDYSCCKITKVENGNYTIESIYGHKGYNTFEIFEKDYHLWTIQDAKDGDVLAEETCTFIIKKLNPNLSAKIYCCLFNDGDFELSTILEFDYISTYPATKKQRDVLFSKMKEAGYEWDAEKKELKKDEEKNIHNKLTSFEFSLKHIIEEAIECGDTHNLKADADLLLRIAQKTSWSEEDKNNINELINDLEDILGTANGIDKNTHGYSIEKLKEQIDWLKSLKYRVQPQLRQEWSEEDEKMLNDIIMCGEHHCYLDAGNIAWLKFLRHQNKQVWNSINEGDFRFLISIIEELFNGKEKVTLCGNGVCAHFTKQDIIERLVSLKPQNTWKPSGEQMEFLYKYAEQNNYDGSVLTSLYQELKKLKEE